MKVLIFILLLISCINISAQIKDSIQIENERATLSSSLNNLSFPINVSLLSQADFKTIFNDEIEMKFDQVKFTERVRFELLSNRPVVGWNIYSPCDKSMKFLQRVY